MISPTGKNLGEGCKPRQTWPWSFFLLWSKRSGDSNAQYKGSSISRICPYHSISPSWKSSRQTNAIKERRSYTDVLSQCSWLEIKKLDLFKESRDRLSALGELKQSKIIFKQPEVKVTSLVCIHAVRMWPLLHISKGHWQLYHLLTLWGKLWQSIPSDYAAELFI